MIEYTLRLKGVTVSRIIKDVEAKIYIFVNLSDKKYTMEQSINNTQKEFKEIQNIIVTHRNRAYQAINTESILTNWEIGKSVSLKIKQAQWGTDVVNQLVDFLKMEQPDLKGFDRRAIYRMVEFYDIYSSDEFVGIASPQIKDIDKQSNTIAGIQSPQFNNDQKILSLLTLINWSSHLEILAGCKIDEERIFYILLSHKEKLYVKKHSCPK